MGRDSVERQKEQALSEVIGFVLILGIITAAFSLYLVYGVPAQGRENEINHMNEVKDQFVAYKLSLDSLFNNNKIGTSVSNSFTLGTGGGYTQGSNSIIPILSPVRSSGVIAINQRTSTPETLNISSYSKILDPTVHTSVSLPLGSSTMINATPQHIYLNISNIQSNDLLPQKPTSYGLQMSGTGWTATVNLSPRMVLSNISTINTQSAICTPPSQQTGTSGSGSGTVYYCLNTTQGTLYNGSDITVSVFKNNESTIQSLAVYKTISAGSYSVDIMDPAYGIQSVMQSPDNLTFSNTLYSPNTTTGSSITGAGKIVYSYAEKDYRASPIELGSLEYRAINNYWISQKYYYQAGGVFLAQNDGNMTWKLPPEISFSNDPVNNIVTVSINALSFDNKSSGLVGGNSPVQIKTTLKSITPLPYAPVAAGGGNTKWIRIGVNTSDDQARVMWKNYFTETARVAGIPNTIIDNTTTETFIIINGSDAAPNGRYDINVIASNGIYSPSVHGVGGIVQ
mgnify:CR=1 FL=1